MNKSKPKIFIAVEWYHFFYEFFEPLIQSIGDRAEVTVLINDLNQEHADLITQRCRSLTNVENVILIKLYGAGLMNSIASVLNLWRLAGKGGLWCFPFLSEPSIRLLSKKIKAGGGKAIMIQNSLLHPNVWDNDEEINNVVQVQKRTPKLLRFDKYYNYSRYLYKIIKIKFVNIVFGLFISPVLTGEFFLRNKKIRFNYLVDESDVAMVFSSREKRLFESVYKSSHVNIVRIPCFNKGVKPEIDGLFIALPGPFKSEIPKDLDDFFDVVGTVISRQKPELIMIRAHPKESDFVKSHMINAVYDKFHNSKIVDVTGKPVFEVLDKSRIIISRPSNLLALSRQYSKHIAAIGVLGSGFEGILATNAQCRDLPDINWVEKSEQIDFNYLNKSEFLIEKETKKDLSSELINLAERYQ